MHAAVLRLEHHLVLARGGVIAMARAIDEAILLALLGDVIHLAVMADNGVETGVALVGHCRNGACREVLQHQAGALGG